jgi:peptidoglycan hydrolase CwlO-like protein
MSGTGADAGMVVGQIFVQYIIPLIIAITGFLMAIGKLKVLRPKETDRLGITLPIAYIEKELSNAAADAKEVRRELNEAKNDIIELRGHVDVLKSEIATLKAEVDRLRNKTGSRSPI